MKNRFAVMLLIAGSALAQNNRSFVSTAGNDANSCLAGTECRSFARAMAVTNPGGEVIAIASGGYGPFTISQAVTVTAAPGVLASMTVASGDGIDIAAGSSDRVIVRGVEITMAASFITGINATSFGTLAIDHCTLIGGDSGIIVTPSGPQQTNITDTIVRGALDNGFVIAGRATLLHCRAENDQVNGLLVRAGTAVDGRVTAVDFVATGGEEGVFVVCETAAHTVSCDLDHSVLSNNTYDGVFGNVLAGTVFVRVSNSVVTENNGYGLNSGLPLGDFQSLGNNFVAGNGTADVHGNILPVGAH